MVLGKGKPKQEPLFWEMPDASEMVTRRPPLAALICGAQFLGKWKCDEQDKAGRYYVNGASGLGFSIRSTQDSYAHPKPALQAFVPKSHVPNGWAHGTLG